MEQATFKVDPQLAFLLSQGYRSSERALKELVDNAWDADAESVKIYLPSPLTNEPIVVEDDGSGMTADQLATEYLNVARNRRVKRGDLTAIKKRQVKGRKGIGKFAGFMAASCMTLETWANGMKTRLQLSKSALEQQADLPEVHIDIHTENDSSGKQGTRITLSELNQTLRFPNPDKLRQLLIQEYGRESGFEIVVNEKPLDIDDIHGSYTELVKPVVGVGDVNIRFTISDQKSQLRAPGIVIRVAGKTVGDPTFFGLERSDDFPEKLLKKCFGEVQADGLVGVVTSDWGAIYEGSEAYLALEEAIQPLLRAKFKEVWGREINLANARLNRKIQERLASLPEHKRDFADKAIKKVLEKYFQEPPSRAEAMVNVLLDALERSDYRTVLERIDDAKHSDVAIFAEALEGFGLVEMARMAEQAVERLKFIDWLEELCGRATTLEKDIHKAIEGSLWLFGPEYSLFSSNITLKRQIEGFLDLRYKGERADNRPDLMLSQNLHNDWLLIEFKRPSHTLKYDDYRQATGYRNEFRQHSMVERIKVLLIGGKRGSDLPQFQDKERDVEFVLFSDLISSARRQFQWLLEQLG